MKPKFHSVRLLTAVNLFKACLLAGNNLPGRAQTDTVVDTISRLTSVGQNWDIDLFTDRTWKSWHSSQTTLPKRSKVRSLDLIFAALDHNDLNTGNEPRFFEEMVFEGLISTLTAPTRSTEAWNLVHSRAMKYSTLSPTHLLLDAIEVAGRIEGYKVVGGDPLRLIAAQRLAELLHEKWNPRDGYFYQNARSDLRIQWEHADTQEKEKIESEWEKLSPGLFSRLLDQGASPNWNLTGIQADIAPQHVYRLLFCLSADRNLLRGERLAAWALDLASAALILFAMAWSNRYETFGADGSPESIFLEALVELLLTEGDLNTTGHYIKPALLEGNVLDDRFCVETFMEARESLKAQLNVLGITPKDLGDVISAAWAKQPLVYAPSSRAAQN